MDNKMIWHEDDITLDVPPSYIEGLDELAEALGVSSGIKRFGITLQGKKGSYCLVTLLNAHVAMMNKVLEKQNGS